MPEILVLSGLWFNYVGFLPVCHYVPYLGFLPAAALKLLGTIPAPSRYSERSAWAQGSFETEVKMRRMSTDSDETTDQSPLAWYV